MNPDPSRSSTSPESEQETVALDAIRAAIDEADASGLGPDDVVARIRQILELREAPHRVEPKLASRTMASGLAARTLRNLEYIRGSRSARVHPVTQVINSLLSVLVFAIEKETAFFKSFSEKAFSNSSGLDAVRDELIDRYDLASIQIHKFGQCKNHRRFFKRLRNAISHKNLEFSDDPDSKVLADVVITFRDRPATRIECEFIDCPRQEFQVETADFDWEISMNAEDLEKLVRFIGNELISND